MKLNFGPFRLPGWPFLGRLLGLPGLALLLGGVALFLTSPGPLLAQVVTPPPLENSPFDAQTFKIADQLQCPVCQGVTVAYSNSGLAQQMRSLIKKKLEQGENREQILQYFVDRYGESILTNPPKNGFTLLVWLLPVVGLLVGAGGVAYVLKVWKTRLENFKPGREEFPVEEGSNLSQGNEAFAHTITPTKGGETSPIPLNAELLKEYEERVERELGGPENPAKEAPGLSIKGNGTYGNRHFL